MDSTANPEFLVEVALAARNAALELCAAADLQAGQTVIVGCSTSEIAGFPVGTHNSAVIGTAVFSALQSVFAERGIYIAAQCCEHLNRAIIVERDVAERYEIVNAVPTPEAGGAFAASAYENFDDPVALEEFFADAGMDIGGTLIGMHLKKVAVPLRIDTTSIGKTTVYAAKTRPKLIGGPRTQYDEGMM